MLQAELFVSTMLTTCLLVVIFFFDFNTRCLIVFRRGSCKGSIFWSWGEGVQIHPSQTKHNPSHVSAQHMVGYINGKIRPNRWWDRTTIWNFFKIYYWMTVLMKLTVHWAVIIPLLNDWRLTLTLVSKVALLLSYDFIYLRAIPAFKFT